MKETSANKLIKEAGIGHSGRQEIANNASTELAEKLKIVPDEISKPLTNKMAEVYENNQRIHLQRKELANKTANLKSLTDQYQTLASGVNSKIKELGDVQNWAELIDQELRVLEETIKIAASNNH